MERTKTNSNNPDVNIQKELLYSSLCYPLRIYQLCGCAPFCFSKNGIERSLLKYLITVIQIGICLSAYLIALYGRLLKGYENDLQLHVAFNATISLISIITIWIESATTVENLSILLRKLGKIDEELMEFNVDLKYSKSKTSLIILAGQLTLPCTFYILMEENIDYFELVFFYAIPHYIITMTGHIYSQMVNLIKERLMVLNNLLQTLTNFDHNRVSTVDDNRNEWSFELLCQICTWHHSLVKSITLLNKTFGFRVVSYIGFSFVILAMHIFLICRCFKIEKNFIILTEYIIFSLCYSYGTYRICQLSEYSIQQVKKAGSLIHQIEASDQSMIDEIVMFSLQIINEDDEFSAAGFFPINYGLLLSIIGGVTTYTIILIQLQGENPQNAVPAENITADMMISNGTTLAY